MIRVRWLILSIIISILKPAMAFAALGMACIHASFRLRARRLSWTFLDRQLSA